MENRRMLSGICRAVLAALVTAAVAAPLYSAEFLYSWTASTDPSVTAYAIYQRTGNSAYQRIDEVRVADLDDPAHPSYRITGLGEGVTFWFAATSITGAGTESDLSDKTCITVNGEVVRCTDQDDSGTTAFVSCFISSVEPRSRR